MRPETEVILIEGRQRRASFLSSAVRDLVLERASVVRGRAEEFVDEFAERFDAVVMRCAGDVAKLFPLAAQFVRAGGLVVASGPPRERPLSLGQWVTVTAWGPGVTRRFAVYRKT